MLEDDCTHVITHGNEELRRRIKDCIIDCLTQL